jgi:hypothetical protein
MDGNNLHGEIYISSSTVTEVTVAGTFYVAGGTYTSGNLLGFSHGTQGRLQYDGRVTQLLHVIICISFSANSADVYHFRVAKNGTTIAKTEQHRNIAAGAVNTLGAVSAQSVTSMATGDYFELWISDSAVAGAEVTVEHAHIVATIA